MSGGISATTMVMMAATAASVAATLYSADSQEKTAEAGAEMQRREGNQQQDAAMAQAEKIRKAGRAQNSAANAAMAASGVAIGEGTPLRINEAIYQDSESDAYSTLLTGTRRQRSSEDQANIMESEGRAAKTGGYLSATASVLSAGSNYNKWQTTQKRAG